MTVQELIDELQKVEDKGAVVQTPMLDLAAQCIADTHPNIPQRQVIESFLQQGAFSQGR